MTKSSSALSFRRRPIPVHPSYRPAFKITLVLLVLKICCRGGKSSLLKLHLFSWALKKKENHQQIIFISQLNNIDQVQFFGIEPALNRALVYSISEGLIEFDNAKYALTEKGNHFCSIILKDTSLFQEEKKVLISVGMDITEKKISQLKGLWHNQNA